MFTIQRAYHVSTHLSRVFTKEKKDHTCANIYFKKVKKNSKKVLTESPSFDIIIFVPSEHAPIAQLDRAFDYESKGHRFESCWVHHKPPTSFALLAVVFYSFVFLSIAWFLKRLSRALASFREVEVRDFLLYSLNQFSGSFWFFGRFATNSATQRVK